MHTTSTSCDSRRLVLYVFLFLNCLFALTSTGRVRVPDEVLTLFQSQNAVLARSFTIPQALETNRFYGRYDRHGQPRAPYPPMHALLATPWYVLGHFVLGRLPGVAPQNLDLVVGFAVTLSSATFAALAAALVLFYFLSAGLRLGSAIPATFMIALATPLFAYSGWFFSEPLATSILVGAACLLIAPSTSIEHPISAQRAFWGGLLLGALIFVRPVHLIATPAFLLALLAQNGMKRSLEPALATLAAVVAATLIYLFWNLSVYGSAFEFGYPVAAEGGKRLNSFETPLALGLFGFLFSPGKSVFLLAPPVMLALWGLPALWKEPKWRSLAVASTVMPLTYLLFYSRYTQWEGGYCFGPRYLLPPVVLLCLGLGPLLARSTESLSTSEGTGSGGTYVPVKEGSDVNRGTPGAVLPRIQHHRGIPLRRVVACLFIAGVAVQLIGLSTSFLEDQASGNYYDEHWNYRLDHSPLLGQGRLFVKYLFSPLPAPLGKGMDRWFLFLAKAKFSPWFIGSIWLLMTAGVITAWMRIQRELRSDGPP